MKKYELVQTVEPDVFRIGPNTHTHKKGQQMDLLIKQVGRRSVLINERDWPIKTEAHITVPHIRETGTRGAPLTAQCSCVARQQNGTGRWLLWGHLSFTGPLCAEEIPTTREAGIFELDDTKHGNPYAALTKLEKYLMLHAPVGTHSPIEAVVQHVKNKLPPYELT